MLKINEIFLSIQGEGISTGLPTIFIRLTGCNLRCNYCDTSYSYEHGNLMSIDEVLEKIKAFCYKRICLTGGEPLAQFEVQALLDQLHDYELNIETNGSIDISKFNLGENHRFTMDVKVPSSGEQNSLCSTNFQYLKVSDEIKFVIGNRLDFEWAKEIIKKYYQKGLITFSPIFGLVNPREVVEWILKDGLEARFQLQLHKEIWHPEERGV